MAIRIRPPKPPGHRITIRLSTRQLDRLDALASHARVSRSVIVRRLIDMDAEDLDDDVLAAPFDAGQAELDALNALVNSPAGSDDEAGALNRLR
jgi:predicted transcriptional regulator